MSQSESYSVRWNSSFKREWFNYEQLALIKNAIIKRETNLVFSDMVNPSPLLQTILTDTQVKATGRITFTIIQTL